MAVCGLTTGNALCFTPTSAIVISHGNDGAQTSWTRRNRNDLSWATGRSSIEATVCAFEPWAEKV